MFGWIKGLVAVFPVAEQQENLQEARPREEEDLFEISMRQARGVFALPADYFSRVKGGLPLPDLELEAVSFRDSVSQNPLYRVMNAVHPDVPQAVRDRLWSDSEFLNIIAHVFHNLRDEDVLAGMEKLDDGYNAVFKQLLSRVLVEGLVGLPRHYSEGRWAYEVK